MKTAAANSALRRALLAGAVLSPLARAQQRPVRRIAILFPLPANPNEQRLADAFAGELGSLGWKPGSTAQVEVQWSSGGIEDVERHAEKLVASAPDILVAAAGAALGPLLQRTRSIPIVFTAVADPAGSGFVTNYARPEGNATGFTSFDNSSGGKWLELLREVAPGVKRVAVLGENRAPERRTSGTGQFESIQAAAGRRGIASAYLLVRDRDSLMTELARLEPGAQNGLLVTSGPITARHREEIIRAAADKKIPAVYFDRSYVTRGGLMSYGSDRVDLYRQAAKYVDRILRGAQVASLPVQAPSKYELVINQATARALGLSIPRSVAILADEMIG